MILANRNGLKNTRNMLRVFGGLNETYSCTEAEYSAGINFSARNFPALSTRTPRRKLREVENLNGMYHLNGLLTVCGKNLIYTPDEAGAAAVTLENAVAMISGCICDGAKASCASKIAMSVDCGILGYNMYLGGNNFRPGDGIMGGGVEPTIRNVGVLAAQGMRETDRVILKIMTE